MIKIEYLEDDEELYEEETDEKTETYGTKKELDDAVDNGDMEAEDALFLEGYMDEED